METRLKFFVPSPASPFLLSSTGGDVNVQEEDNFLEKARRCMLRAIGLSSRKSILASESGGGSFRAGRTVPETAEEIEAKQKIKVCSMRRYRVRGRFFGSSSVVFRLSSLCLFKSKR